MSTVDARTSSAMGTVVAVLLTCHGTVDRVEELPAFLLNIRRGRPAPAELVAEVTRRFEEIGGSPLMRITGEQAAALQARLQLPVRWAGRLWGPYPKDVIGELASDGIDTILSLPLAPQSVHIYNVAVKRAADALGLATIAAPSWALEPKLLDAFAAAIVEARGELDTAQQVAVVLTAHSLPLRVIASGDPYQSDFEQMAEAVIQRLGRHGIERDAVRIAYQSQSLDGGEWLGPDLDTILRELSGSARGLIIAPIGFVADHVETLYDIDVHAVALARQLGFVQVQRMAAMNTRPDFIDALEAVTRRLLP